MGLVIKDVNRVEDLIRIADMCHKSLPLEALFADVAAAVLPARISFVCLSPQGIYSISGPFRCSI